MKPRVHVQASSRWAREQAEAVGPLQRANPEVGLQGEAAGVGSVARPGLRGANLQGVRRGTQDHAQIHTDEFRAWFGLSKVVDEAGNPLRVMHGSPHAFSVFMPGGTGAPGQLMKSGAGIWFTDLQDGIPAAHHVATRSGGFVPGTSVYPVYLRIERPLLIDDLLSLEWAREAFAGGSMEFPQLLASGWVDEVRKNQDYDGILFKGEDLGWGPGSNEYIVFEPTQIKSALGNCGAFDPSNPDIRS